MIIVRFSTVLSHVPPVIALRFGRDSDEASPDWPILQPNMSTARTLYGCSSLHSTDVRMRSSRYDIRLRSHLFCITRSTGSLVRLPVKSHTVQNTAKWISTGWENVQAKTVFAWLSDTESNAMRLCSSNSALLRNVYSVRVYSGKVLQSLGLGYQKLYKAFLPYQSGWRARFCEHPVPLVYGPKPAEWRCVPVRSNIYGQATLRFNSKSSARRIAFEPVAMSCRWDEGGGYKHAHDVLPALDFTVPIEPAWRRSYVMQPSIICERLSDGQTIAISQITISQRRGNFAKAVSVTFQSHIDMQRARNEPLKVVINGYEHRVLIERFSTSRRFGDANFQGQGRSLLALLASPYQLPITYANSTPRSLLGILSDLLNGSGWTVKAQGFSDFTIPEGAFSVQGKAPIEAIAAQLDGIGVILLSNDIRKELTLVAKWPIVPWQMANQSPAIVFHQGVIQSLSESEELSPLCNGVYVRGEQVGVSAHVKRQGTAGNITPNDISHPLIVTAIAAQLCGTAALADTGKKRQWQLTAPVMATLPIVTEGQLIGIRDELDLLYIAMIDSWSVTASIAADGAVSVKQSFTALEPLEV